VAGCMCVEGGVSVVCAERVHVSSFALFSLEGLCVCVCVLRVLRVLRVCLVCSS